MIIRRSLEEPSAFAELFERHAAPIGRFAAQRVGAESAKDVLSETFLIAFRKRASFDSAWDSAAPWLFGIASRVIHKQRAREARHWRSVVASAAVAESHAPSGAERADERVDAASGVQALSARLAALPARDRETLLLYAWGDLTYEQIAVALDVPVGTVRSRLNRVRKRLGAPETQTTREEESNGRTVEQGA